MTINDWRPGASPDALLARAQLLRQIRAFFSARDVLEVETPMLGRYGVTDPAIEPLRAGHAGTTAASEFLQTSPEFFMKRLLAAGSGPIYQLGRAFRAGESGSRHNPEFTLLEWYRPGFDLPALMSEVEDLLLECLSAAGNACPPVEHLSYAQAFVDSVGLNPHRANEKELMLAAEQVTDTAGLVLDRDGWLDLLMTHAVEPALRSRGLIFVYDYPASQAALARCYERNGTRVADRFEVYLDGMELANGYRELLDADEHVVRAERDNRVRQAMGTEERELDPRLLDALASGLPDCSGVALGVDRLLMRILDVRVLDEVLAFSWERR
ncbi:MAG: EF-P lysine aminoacylase EpmA [Pseudomonadota bacterium]